MDGDKVVATVVSLGTRFAVAMTPHEALRLGHAMVRAASESIKPPKEAILIAFPSKARA